MSSDGSRDPEVGLVVERLNASGVVRFHRDDDVTDVQLSDLLEIIGELADSAPVRQYLLFGGLGAASGSVKDLLEVFGSEEDARRAFQRLRLRGNDALPVGWAELVALDRGHGVHILCSFGRGRPVRWRPNPLPEEATAVGGLRRPVHLSRTKKGTAMSTDTITEPTVTTRVPDGRPRRMVYRLTAALAGLAAFGGLLLAGVGGNPTSPAPAEAPAGAQPSPLLKGEVFPGCLNDIECYGEPSRLAPGYWDVPTTAGID